VRIRRGRSFPPSDGLSISLSAVFGVIFDGFPDGVESLRPDEGGSGGGVVSGEVAVEAGGGFGVLEFGVSEDFAA